MYRDDGQQNIKKNKIEQDKFVVSILVTSIQDYERHNVFSYYIFKSQMTK